MIPDPLTCELLRMARVQSALLSSQFIAPVTRGRGVLVRLAGSWCSMMIVPPSFGGWGIFRPLTSTVAVYCRKATASERMNYLSLLPHIPLVADVGNSRGNAPGKIEIDGASPPRPGENRTAAESLVSLGMRLSDDEGTLDLTGLEGLFPRDAGGSHTRWN
jgi:hypothetical protein